MVKVRVVNKLVFILLSLR